MLNGGLDSRNALTERLRARIEAQSREVERIWQKELRRLSADLRRSCQEELNTILNDTARIGKAILEEITSQYRAVRRMTVLVWIWIGGLILVLVLLTALTLKVRWLPLLPPQVEKIRTDQGTFLVFPQRTEVYKLQDGRIAVLIERR